MKKLSPLILFVLTLLLGSSCTSDEALYQEDLATQISKDKTIIKTIEDFRNKVQNKSRYSSPLTIYNISRESYSKLDNTLYPSRNTNEDTELVDVVTVTFIDEENDGFALVCQNDSLAEVLFYTDNGNPSDTTFIEPLKHIFCAAPYVGMSLLENGNPLSPDTISGPGPGIIPPFPSSLFVGNIVLNRWGQNYPYNMFAPYSNAFGTSYNGRYPIGCVPVALGQFLATVGKYTQLDTSAFDLDLENLACIVYPEEYEDSVMVGHFLHELATRLDTWYISQGGVTMTYNITQLLNELGYNCVITDTFDNNRIYCDLLSNIPIITIGESSSSSHCWLITGFQRDSESIYHYYCNWGWNGFCNGWAAGNFYTAQDPNSSYEKQYPYSLSNYKINSIPE